MLGVITFDRTPDVERFDAVLRNLVGAFPRFRQRVAGDPLKLAPPRWEPDPYFDLAFHLVRANAPGEGTQEDLLRVAAYFAMSSFDLARPLWRVALVEGLADGRAALVLKVHHSLSDGVGFVQVIGMMVQLGRDDPPATRDELPAGRHLGAGARLVDAFVYRARESLGMVGGLARAARGTRLGGGPPLGSLARVFKPAFRKKSPLMTGRSLNVHYDTITLSLDELKAASSAAGGKLNDAFMAGIAGGLRRYHERHGAVSGDLRVNMPVNFRDPESTVVGGNYFVPARWLLPTGIADPLECMREIRGRVQAVLDEPAMASFSSALRELNRAPLLSVPLFGAMLKSVDVAASNVPGPPIPLYCAGAEIEEMFPFGPLGGAALNVTLFSYNKRLCLTINVDTAAVPDIDELHACLEQGFAEVLACGQRARACGVSPDHSCWSDALEAVGLSESGS